MSTSLIPERPLLISPTLAATIGLQEAVFLHVISELLLQHPPLYRQQRRWSEINLSTLINALPFWDPTEIKRVQRSVQDLGLLLVEAVRGSEVTHLYAINQEDCQANGNIAESERSRTQASETTAAAPYTTAYATSHALQPRATPYQNTSGTATLIPPDWQPDATLYQLCQQRNIPRPFVEEHVQSFVMYWRERQKTQYSWHQTFLKWIVTEWEKQRSFQGAKELETQMSSNWLPSEEAVCILEYAGVSHGFIEDAIPEFVLYWRERGIVNSTWSTKFIAHVRRQWERYRHALENDTTPRPIPRDFKPSAACFDVLAMANIDAEFAHAQVQEFILYWQDRNDIHASWNTKFLQHVKYQWAQHMQNSQPLLEKLADRSWAN
jgi:hypothetical protein